jgi:predicted lipoprotein with Yx(FWY)xxD motif
MFNSRYAIEEVAMRRQLAFILPPAALTGIALVAAGCGGTSHAAATGGSGSAYGSATPAAKKPATVVTRSTGLGKVLVDGQGRTLYLFEKDKGRRAVAPARAPVSGRR